MENRGFSATAPFTMAQDVSIETVTYIEENGTMFRGAEISVNSIREYVSASTASHVLGVSATSIRGTTRSSRKRARP
jgi:penicillin-binding protein 2